MFVEKNSARKKYWGYFGVELCFALLVSLRSATFGENKIDKKLVTLSAGANKDRARGNRLQMLNYAIFTQTKKFDNSDYSVIVKDGNFS